MTILAQASHQVRPSKIATVPVEVVGRALVADRLALDSFPVLSELPVIEQWSAAHPRELLCKGKALHTLLRRAVSDVAFGYAKDEDATLRRLAEFVRLRYIERLTVTEIAQRWRMNRSGVSHRFSGQAIQLVARRFEQLVHVIRCSADDLGTHRSG
jgi:hypothetical protein